MDCRRVSNVSFLWKPILFIDILEIKGFETKTKINSELPRRFKFTCVCITTAWYLTW